MKKTLFIAALAIGALVSCSENEFVGDTPSTNSSNEVGAISFGTGIRAITRADYTGYNAANKLNYNFVVDGVKWNGDKTDVTDTKYVVFDHYNVNWLTTDNGATSTTAHSTLSNATGWEYVGQPTEGAYLAYGPGTTTADRGLQAIKYWDYDKSQYDFIAYSAGGATVVYDVSNYVAANNVYITEIDASKMNGVDTTDPEDQIIDEGAYTIKGKASELSKIYIADLVTAYRDKETANDALGDYQETVQFKFRSLSAKVRIGLYETIPGYSVQNVVFYTDANTPATVETGKTWSAAHLFTTGSGAFNEEGVYIVYFPTTGSDNQDETDYNKAHLKFKPATDQGVIATTTVKAFGNMTGSLQAEELATAEDKETAGNYYLGRSSDAAIYAGNKSENYYTTVLPNEEGAVLNLKVNYQLVPTDGNDETINVTGATAQVPAVFAQWKSGYAYTYLFKISLNTNGVTNPEAGPAGLYPITLDAVVTETEDGVQETITTVSEPSITTYAKGVNPTANDEYLTGSNIYIIVDNGTALTVESTPNAKLYTVTLEGGAAQTINEASVANALVNGKQDPTGTWTVTDKNGKKMVVTSATGLTAPNEIAATDAPDGNKITVNCAKFTPSAAGYYVFEYIDGTNKYYKIINVVAASSGDQGQGGGGSNP